MREESWRLPKLGLNPWSEPSGEVGGLRSAIWSSSINCNKLDVLRAKKWNHKPETGSGSIKLENYKFMLPVTKAYKLPHSYLPPL